MHLNGNETLYLWHELLRHLGMFVFYSFGALLFFELTGSIASVFMIGCVYFATGILSRSITLPLFLYIKDKIGVVAFMGIGLAIVAGVNGLLFVLGASDNTPLSTFFILMIVSSIGTGMYWTFSNIIKLTNIGTSASPGMYSSYLVIARLIASVVATVVGLVLSFNDHFLVLLALSAIILFISLIPLTKMNGLNHKESFRLRNIFTRMTPLALLANIRLTPELVNYGIPLFFLMTYESVPKSVLLTGLSYIIAITLSYYVGKCVDHKNRMLIIVSIILVMLSFFLFTQTDSASLLVMLAALIGTCRKSIKIGSNTRLGKEIAQSHSKIEFIAGIEVARNLGSSLTLVLLLICFLWFGTIPQLLFALGAIMIIPDALYASGWKSYS